MFQLFYSSSGGISVCAVFGIDHAENISNCLSYMLPELEESYCINSHIN